MRSPVELRAMTPGLARHVRAARGGGHLAAALGPGRRRPGGLVRRRGARRGGGQDHRRRHRRHRGRDAGDRHRRHRRPGLLPAVDAGPDLGAAAAADQVEPNPSETEEVVGLRLDDNSAVATGQVVQTIWNLYNGPDQNSASAVERYSTWQQVKQSMASNDRLLGLLLALFGIIALVAAPCAIANVTAGRVLVQRQDIAMLKAPRVHPRPGGADAAGRADRARRGRGRARAGRGPDRDLAGVRPAAGRHAGGPGAAVRLMDGADRRRHRAHRRGRHRHPGLAGGPGVAGGRASSRARRAVTCPGWPGWACSSTCRSPSSSGPGTR